MHFFYSEALCSSPRRLGGIISERSDPEHCDAFTFADIGTPGYSRQAHGIVEVSVADLDRDLAARETAGCDDDTFSPSEIAIRSRLATLAMLSESSCRASGRADRSWPPFTAVLGAVSVMRSGLSPDSDEPLREYVLEAYDDSYYKLLIVLYRNHINNASGPSAAFLEQYAFVSPAT